MAEPEDRDSLEVKEAFKNFSVYDIDNTTYPNNMIIEHSLRHSCEQTEFSEKIAVSSAVSGTLGAGKDKGRSDSLVSDTQPAEEVSDFTIAKRSVLPASAKSYAQPTYGPSAYFRCTILNFNPLTVDLNKIGITYEYGDHYFVVIQLPHPQTNEQILQCGFMHRRYVRSYLVCEWESLVKEQVGECGIAVCEDDGRWAIHSGTLQYMRYLCGQVGKALQYRILPDAQKRGVNLHVEKVKAQLSKMFTTVLGRVDSDTKMKEREAAKEADRFMEEFMVFEE